MVCCGFLMAKGENDVKDFWCLAHGAQEMLAK